jgi:hypothetical protein
MAIMLRILKVPGIFSVAAVVLNVAARISTNLVPI